MSSKRRIIFLIGVVLVGVGAYFYENYYYTTRVASAIERYCGPDSFGSGMNVDLYVQSNMEQYRRDFVRGKIVKDDAGPIQLGDDKRSEFLPLCSGFGITKQHLYMNDTRIMPYNESLQIIGRNYFAHDDNVYFVNVFEEHVVAPLSGAQADDVHLILGKKIMGADGQEYGGAYLISNGNYYFKDKLIEGAIPLD